ncbi:MAG: sulfite exporter TauE/SafE family protein [Bacteroidetes bacterium]|nr:MAG: sulfite exporter TauE/SafE family protein [Bacteroidota bacterium]
MWLTYLLLIFTGIVSGFVNTLAGSGSLINLTVLMFVGLPANIANATSRLGILLQSITGVWVFYKNGKIDLKKSIWFLIPMVLGAIFGAQTASFLSEEATKSSMAVMMFLMLFLILLKPEKWLKEKSEIINEKTVLNFIIFLVIGFYGGFLMSGVGILILAALVLRSGYNLTEANALKILAVFLFTVPVVCIFIFHKQIIWEYGFFMAIGQGIGAWFAAKFAIKSKSANLWTHRLLILVVLASILQILEIDQWILKLFYKIFV